MLELVLGGIANRADRGRGTPWSVMSSSGLSVHSSRGRFDPNDVRCGFMVQYRASQTASPSRTSDGRVPHSLSAASDPSARVKELFKSSSTLQKTTQPKRTTSHDFADARVSSHQIRGHISICLSPGATLIRRPLESRIFV